MSSRSISVSAKLSMATIVDGDSAFCGQVS
jgi:hypothetical protein